VVNARNVEGGVEVEILYLCHWVVQAQSLVRKPLQLAPLSPEAEGRWNNDYVNAVGESILRVIPQPYAKNSPVVYLLMGQLEECMCALVTKQQLDCRVASWGCAIGDARLRMRTG
jgi:hypothetical protein